ncbi:hypothetical protein BC832DRAFT_538937 [Gaertneriomyces semiglobifer]|nr:hypothetical protein BC832DRAFT_538937 [Gaertneriomyces semiglobifer]
MPKSISYRENDDGSYTVFHQPGYIRQQQNQLIGDTTQRVAHRAGDTHLPTTSQANPRRGLTLSTQTPSLNLTSVGTQVGESHGVVGEMERINFSTQTEPPVEMRRDTIVRDFTTHAGRGATNPGRDTNPRSSVERSTSPVENRFVTAPRPHVPSTPPEPMQVSPPPRQRSGWRNNRPAPIITTALGNPSQVPSSTLPGYSHSATPPPSYIAPMTPVASSRSSGTVTTTQSMFNERTPIAPATNERERRASTELERTRTRPYTSTPISLTQPIQSASVETSGGTPVVPAMAGNGVITTPVVAEREQLLQHPLHIALRRPLQFLYGGQVGLTKHPCRDWSLRARHPQFNLDVQQGQKRHRKGTHQAILKDRKMAKKKKANKVGLTATEIRNDPWRRVIAHPTRKAQKSVDDTVTAPVQEVATEASVSVPDASSSIGAPKEEKKKRPMTEKQKAALQKAQAARGQRLRDLAKTQKEQDEQKRIQEAKELLQKHKDRIKMEREAKKLAKESNPSKDKEKKKEPKKPKKSVSPAVQVEVPLPSKLIGRIEEEEPRPSHVFAVFDDDNPYNVIFGRRHSRH